MRSRARRDRLQRARTALRRFCGDPGAGEGVAAAGPLWMLLLGLAGLAGFETVLAAAQVRVELPVRPDWMRLLQAVPGSVLWLVEMSGPVRANLVDHPNEYSFSSARQLHGRQLENEPLCTDHQQISWRK